MTDYFTSGHFKLLNKWKGQKHDEAWGYIVNGKTALDWVMERQAVRVDKASGIVNDANDWAIETMCNPAYPLELFQRVVTVSLETQKIVAALPPLDIREDG